MAKEKIIGVTRGFFKEFRSFAVKGNALELAFAVVIGTAFTTVVNSLVADLITPLLGLLTNNVDFKTLAVTLRPDVVLKYGSFIQALINFLLVSFSIFLVFKLLTAARKRMIKEGEKSVPAHEKPAQERLLEEIRDLLKEKKGSSLE